MRSTATFVVEDTKIFHDDTLSLESKNEEHKYRYESVGEIINWKVHE